MVENTEVGLHKLDGKLQRMLDTIETVKDSQEAMAEDISKIKEAMYNPDEGLYARVRELETGLNARVKELEVWKSSQTKLVWILVTTCIGCIAALIAGVNISVGP